MSVFILFVLFTFCESKILTLRSVRKERVPKNVHTIEHIIHLGSKVTTPCFPEEKPESTSEYHWLHHSGEPVLNILRYKVSSTGDLTIEQVSPDDSGIFICKAKSKSGRIVEVNHKMKVIQLPTTGLHVYFTYNLDQCLPAFEKKASEHITSLLKGNICKQKECKKGTVHGNCYQDNLSTPLLKVTVPLLLPEVPTGQCDEECTRKRINGMREKVVATITEVVMKREPLELPFHKPLKPSNFEDAVVEICDPGFEYVEDNCVPCNPGHFLRKNVCTQCHKNDYVAKYAATECRPCNGSETVGEGAKSIEECNVGVEFIIIIIKMLFFFLFLIALSCCCCCWCIRKAAGGSNLGICMDKFCSACCFCNFIARLCFTKINALLLKRRDPTFENESTSVSEASSTATLATDSGSTLPFQTTPPPPPPPPPLASSGSKIENKANAVTPNPIEQTVHNLQVDMPPLSFFGGGDFYRSKSSWSKYPSVEMRDSSLNWGIKEEENPHRKCTPIIPV